MKKQTSKMKRPTTLRSGDLLGHIGIKFVEVIRKHINAFFVSRSSVQCIRDYEASSRPICVLILVCFILVPHSLQARPVFSESLDSINRLSQNGNALLNENLRFVFALVPLGAHVGSDLVESVSSRLDANPNRFFGGKLSGNPLGSQPATIRNNASGRPSDYRNEDRSYLYLFCGVQIIGLFLCAFFGYIAGCNKWPNEKS
jgi:hypothetical protein